MVRIVVLVVAMMLASCAAGASSGPSGPSAAASASASSGGEEPAASASAKPWVDPAAGLALVQFPDPDSPVSHIFVVEVGGKLRQVTGVSRSSPGASDPAWSPDQTQIAFGPPKTGAGMTFEVGVVNADGSDERVVGIGQNPRWSPDGARLLFEEVDDVTSEPRSMYVVDVATAEVTELGMGFNPRWLPDGRISFQRMVNGTSVLYVMSADGGKTEELAQEAEGFWSPDGSGMLLVREGVIWLAEPDGSAARELVNGYDPVWSPDGSRIAFTSDVSQDGVPVMAVVDLEGQEIWSRVLGSSPAWSPDGTRLAVGIGYPAPVVRVLDAASGAVVWETVGADPAW